MARDLVSLAHRYFDALNAFDLATAEAMYAEDATYHSRFVGTLAGRKAIFRAFRQYFAEYSDQSAATESVELFEPNAVRTRWRLTATARSTGLPLVRRGSERITFDANGLIARVEVEDQ